MMSVTKRRACSAKRLFRPLRFAWTADAPPAIQIAACLITILEKVPLSSC
jgi:hypothetical protein